MRRHPRRAQVDPTSPRAWATSDRSGMLGNHENLVWQFMWSGFELINTRVLVYPDELDIPNRQLGSIVLPPDPPSIRNARPEPYYIDEQTFVSAQDGVQLSSQDGQSILASNLQGLVNAGASSG